jgi:hypothetical protein
VRGNHGLDRQKSQFSPEGVVTGNTLQKNWEVSSHKCCETGFKNRFWLQILALLLLAVWVPLDILVTLWNLIWVFCFLFVKSGMMIIS